MSLCFSLINLLSSGTCNKPIATIIHFISGFIAKMDNISSEYSLLQLPVSLSHKLMLEYFIGILVLKFTY